MNKYLLMLMNEYVSLKIEKRSILWTKMHFIHSFGPVSKGLVPVFDHFEIIIF